MFMINCNYYNCISYYYIYYYIRAVELNHGLQKFYLILFVDYFLIIILETIYIYIIYICGKKNSAFIDIIGYNVP